jgi:hypothetical protein
VSRDFTLNRSNSCGAAILRTGFEPARTVLQSHLAARRLALLQVVALLPPGVDRDQAIADVLAFMKSEGIERYSHVEWFYPVRQLLNGHKESATERDWMLRALLDSGDPVMRLYAQVEEFLGLP